MLKKRIALISLVSSSVIFALNFGGLGQFTQTMVNNDTAGQNISFSCNGGTATTVAPSTTTYCPLNNNVISTITNTSSKYERVICTYEFGVSTSNLYIGESMQCPNNTLFINVWALNFAAVDAGNSPVNFQCDNNSPVVSLGSSLHYDECSQSTPASPVFTNTGSNTEFLVCLFGSGPLVQKILPGEVTTCGNSSLAGIVFGDIKEFATSLKSLNLKNYNTSNLVSQVSIELTNIKH